VVPDILVVLHSVAVPLWLLEIFGDSLFFICEVVVKDVELGLRVRTVVLLDHSTAKWINLRRFQLVTCFVLLNLFNLLLV